MNAVRRTALAVMVVLTLPLPGGEMSLAADSGRDRYRPPGGLKHGGLSIGLDREGQRNAADDGRSRSRKLRFGQGYEYRMSVQQGRGSGDVAESRGGRH